MKAEQSRGRSIVRRVLIVGGGSIGERHARCFIKTGRAEVALCEIRPQRLEEMAARYPLSGAFDDLEKVELSRFDAAVICVPAHLHIPCARRAVEAGCNVFIEKPLSVDLEGVPELQRTAEEKALIVGVAYVRRAARISRIVEEEIDSGRAGEILDITYSAGYDHRVARPDYRNTYEVSRAMGGGVIHDQISHLANLLQWFMGPVTRVMAWYDHLMVEGMDAEDTVSVILHFRDSKAVATLHSCMWHPCRTDLLTLSSNDAQILCDGWGERIGVFRRDTNEWTWTQLDVGERDEKAQVDAPFVAEAANFLDAIEGKAEVLCSLQEAAHTVEICMAATESGRHGCAVEI